MIIRQSESTKSKTFLERFSKIYNSIFYIIVALALINLISSVAKTDWIAILVSINAIIIGTLLKYEIKH